MRLRITRMVATHWKWEEKKKKKMDLYCICQSQDVSEPLVWKKKRNRILGSSRRSISSREGEVLMHRNVLPGITMHIFGHLHSRKKNSYKEVQKSGASQYNKKRELTILEWGAFAGFGQANKNSLGGDRITAYKCIEMVKPRSRKLFSWKDNVDTHIKAPEQIYARN